MKLIIENWRRFLKESVELTEEQVQLYLAFCAIALYKGPASNSLFTKPKKSRSDYDAFQNWYKSAAKAFESAGVDPSNMEEIRKKIFESLKKDDSSLGDNLWLRDEQDIMIVYEGAAQAMLSFIKQYGKPNKSRLYSGGMFYVEGLNKEDFKIFKYGNPRMSIFSMIKSFDNMGMPKEQVKKLIDQVSEPSSTIDWEKIPIPSIQQYKAALLKKQIEETRSEEEKAELQQVLEASEFAGDIRGEAFNKWTPDKKYWGSFGLYKTFEDAYNADVKDIKQISEEIVKVRNIINNIKPDASKKRRRIIHSFSLNLGTAAGFAFEGVRKREGFFSSVMIVEPGDAPKTLNLITDESAEDEILVHGEYDTIKVEFGSDGIVYEYVRFK